jgi:hypothetical protein
MAIATFPQPLYAKTLDGDQLIVLAVSDSSSFVRGYLVMYNDAGHAKHGQSFIMPLKDVIFEHFYWPEIEPADSVEGFGHPQEPALKVW